MSIDPLTRILQYQEPTRSRPVHRTLSVVPSKKLAGIQFVCECLHCMATMTKEATVSVRLTAREKSGLDADARMKGIPSGTAAAGYIAEGVRRSRFPAIEFRDGQPGRVAYLVGSRWPVWMIVELVRELDGDLTEAVKLIRKPAALVRMALAYADAYPQEIKDSGGTAGPATISYTAGGCAVTHDITVNPMPSPIGGATGACAGATYTLTNGVFGGNWSSGNLSVAAIGSVTGVVTDRKSTR